jgi:hypothetical protein
MGCRPDRKFGGRRGFDLGIDRHQQTVRRTIGWNKRVRIDIKGEACDLIIIIRGFHLLVLAMR